MVEQAAHIRRVRGSNPFTATNLLPGYASVCSSESAFAGIDPDITVGKKISIRVRYSIHFVPVKR